MKKYCTSCGYGNEYSSSPPEKCEKCKKSMEATALRLVCTNPTIKANQSSVTEELTDELEDSEFDTFLEEPEKFSEKEIAGLFLVNANQGFNLGEFVEEERRKIEETAPAKPKSRGRKRK